MPNSHEISAAEALARVRVWGPPDVISALGAIEDLARDSKFEPHFRVFVDARELDEGDAPLEHIEQVANTLRSLRERFQGRVAIAARVGTHFDLLNLMCAFAGTYGVEIRVFSEKLRAEAWLTEP